MEQITENKGGMNFMIFFFKNYGNIAQRIISHLKRQKK